MICFMHDFLRAPEVDSEPLRDIMFKRSGRFALAEAVVQRETTCKALGENMSKACLVKTVCGPDWCTSVDL